MQDFGAIEFPIAARLKEERMRLGISQTRFSELAGVSKRTLVNWEKGDGSPTAVALAAFADAGADAFYILTGKRHTLSWSQREDWGVQDMLDNLELGLEAPAEAAKRHKITEEQAMETARSTLSSIASSDAEEVRDADRERADDLLRQYFHDEDAAKRRSARYAAISNRRRRAEIDLEDAISGVSVSIRPETQQALLQLIVEYRMSPTDVVNLLQCIRSEMGR